MRKKNRARLAFGLLSSLVLAVPLSAQAVAATPDHSDRRSASGLGATLPAVAGPKAAALAALEYTYQQCLDGDLVPSSLLNEFRLGSAAEYIYLRCGSPVSTGLLHIDNGHPINDTTKFGVCLARIMFEGGPVGPGSAPNSTMWRVGYSGGRATLSYENNTGNIITMYTSTGARGNNWGKCAQG